MWVLVKLTVVLFANLVHYPVHGPAVEVIIRENLEREAVFLLVLLDGLLVSFDTSAYRQGLR
jgi:hypothetical protein